MCDCTVAIQLQTLSRLALVMVGCMVPVAVRADPLIIAEFMATNDTTLVDADGDTPDWIEVVNVSANIVNTDGWHLTDEAVQLTKWRFPPTELGPGESLIVFASDKDRIDPDIHTNFRLASGGDYLALVEPDGQTIATQFRPRFPPQFAHTSFGIRPESNVTPLMAAGSTVRVLVPTDDTLGNTWIEPGFDDSGWLSGPAPIGI